MEEELDNWMQEVDKDLEAKMNYVSPHKIMVFTQSINDINKAVHDVFKIPKKDFGYCFYHHDGRGGFADNIQYVIKMPFIMEDTQICMECAMRLYGGYRVQTQDGVEVIPTDPLLDYLNEIDPIDEGVEIDG